jgi:hypothetical protein
MLEIYLDLLGVLAMSDESPAGMREVGDRFLAIATIVGRAFRAHTQASCDLQCEAAHLARVLLILHAPQP